MLRSGEHQGPSCSTFPQIFSGSAAEGVAAAFQPQRGRPPQLSAQQDPGDESLLTRRPSAAVHRQVFGPRSLQGANGGSRLGNERPCKFWPVQPPRSFTVHILRLRNQGQERGGLPQTLAPDEAADPRYTCCLSLGPPEAGLKQESERRWLIWEVTPGNTGQGVEK